MLDQITVLVLTYNEEPNLARTLDQLRWAGSVVVVDSFSTDATLEIAARYPNVHVLQRAFDGFAQQLNHALDHAPIRTEWVLVLDADYVLTPELVTELAAQTPAQNVTGYRCRFRYCIDGTALRASLYPPSIVLFRRALARYRNDGHAYRVTLQSGEIGELQGRIDHDDRKSLSRWLASQNRYAAQEAEKLAAAKLSELGWPDRVRKVPMLAPLVVLPYCLFAKGCVLDGRAGLIYTAQRTIAEWVLAVHMQRRDPR